MLKFFIDQKAFQIFFFYYFEYWNYLDPNYTPPFCVPYSKNACETLAGKRGLKFETSTYATKGCYTYETGEYSKTIYYGTGGSEDDMKAKPTKDGQIRPVGYDCKSGNSFLFICGNLC